MSAGNEQTQTAAGSLPVAVLFAAHPFFLL
jgi:hypothetical protein